MIARRALVALVALSVLAACSDDDDATDPATTDAPATSDSTPTTDAPATTEATTTTTSTTPPSTTSPEEALKVQIAEDYMAAEDAIYALVHEPSLDQLAERVALVAAPGSPFYDQMVARVTELVELGDIVTANDPDIHRVEIESIDLVDADSAVLTVCRVTNQMQVTPGASPTGEDILKLGTGELIASRSSVSVVRTANGWLEEGLGETLGVWPGQEECAPA